MRSISKTSSTVLRTLGYLYNGHVELEVQV